MTIAIIYFSTDLQAQEPLFEWVAGFGDSNIYDYSSGQAIAIDDSGNVFTTGHFEGTVDFDPGSGTYNLSSNGDYDIFILKLSQVQVLIADFIASDTSIVLGDTIQFIDLYNGTPTDWLWDFGDGTTDTSQNPIHIYQSVGTYTISLIIYDSFSSDTIERIDYIVVNPLPLAYNYFISDVLCNGDLTGEINISITGGLTPYSFLWSNGATTENLSNLGVGFYSLTLSDSYAYVDTLSFFVLEPDPLEIEAIINNIESGDSVGSIILTTFGGTPPYSYFWSDSSISESLFSLSAGNYYVSVSDSNDCMLDSSFILLDLTSVNENVYSSDLIVFPNPFTNETQISYSLPKISDIQLSIYSSEGRLIRILEKNNKTAGNHTTIWDGKNSNKTKCSSGIYIIELKINDKMKYNKVSIRR